MQNEETNNSKQFSNFKEVKIGQQVWMAENLNTDKFRNGDPIPEAKSEAEWEKSGKYKLAACVADKSPASCEGIVYLSAEALKPLYTSETILGTIGGFVEEGTS